MVLPLFLVHQNMRETRAVRQVVISCGVVSMAVGQTSCGQCLVAVRADQGGNVARLDAGDM